MESKIKEKNTKKSTKKQQEDITKEDTTKIEDSIFYIDKFLN